MKRAVLILIVALVLLEICLQFLAKKVNPYGSYANFFENAKVTISSKNPSKTIFFVGDSTIFGGGASNETLFSLPAQFQSLLRRAKSPYEVVNLGYPGTTGKEHLEILRLLPQEATVIMRTGINDSWKRHESYKLNLLGQYYEIRVLKLLMIAWYGWGRDENVESTSLDYLKELQNHSSQKQFNLYFVDYFLGEKTFMNTYFKEAENFIPLAKILKQNGFASNQTGLVSKKYLSYDLVHANDLGYKLQAQALYNWFASRQKLNLRADDQIKLIVDQESIQELQRVLDNALLKLKESKRNADDQIAITMRAAWQLYVLTGNLYFKEKYDRLSGLLVFAFHQTYPLINTLNREHRIRLTNTTYLEDAEINFLFQLIKILDESPQAYIKDYLEKFPGIIDSRKVYSDYSFLQAPFPLELCKKFIRETNPNLNKISILENWTEFFGEKFPMNELAQNNLKNCS